MILQIMGMIVVVLMMKKMRIWKTMKMKKMMMIVMKKMEIRMILKKNIMKKPMVWLPTIIVSAILGPVSTCWLELVCMGSSSGMGTAGLVGQIGTFSSMGNTWQTWVGIIALEIIAPAVLVYCVDLLFRRFNLIKDGDLKV